MIPANETEFAKDKTFGYSAATMPEYVEEKTKGAYKASDVTCISLEDIHDMNIDKIEEALMEVKDFNKIIVNAVDYADVKYSVWHCTEQWQREKYSCSVRRQLS